MKQTFAGKVRTAVREIGKGGKPWTIKELAVEKLDLISDKDKRPLYSAIQEMERRGEIVKVSPGVYRTGKKRQGKDELQYVMWRILRHRGRLTVDDLMELAGCSEGYALEWLQMLDKRGVIRRITKPGVNGIWQLIEDQVEIPTNDAKADRLRELRIEKRKAAIARANAQLDAAYQSILQARMEINGIE